MINSKKSLQNQLEEVIKEKKKLSKFEKFDEENSDQIATKNKTKTRETQGKCPGNTKVNIGN